MARKPADQVQLKLRFDERLRGHLEREAARNQRSMNAEIIARLEQSFDRRELFPQVLTLAYGPDWGAFLADAHRNGVLTLRDQDKKHILGVIGQFIDSKSKKPGAKS